MLAICRLAITIARWFAQTHKTGSSTVTNILHRVIQSYGYSPAVPTGNLYYAWCVRRWCGGWAQRGDQPFWNHICVLTMGHHLG